MINPKIQQAVAAAIALGAAAGAQAVDITVVAPANIIHISGSTAIDPGLRAFWTNAVDNYCDPAPASSAYPLGGYANNPIDYYAQTVAPKYLAVSCIGGAGTTYAGVPVAFIKEDNAGSLNGITPVNQTTPSGLAPFPSVALMTTPVGTVAGNCPFAVAATSEPQTPTGQNPQFTHTCGAAVTTDATIVSNLGFSDVDAALFGAAAGNLNAFNSLDAIFAPAVSLGFYHALQAVQGIAATNQDDALAHIPSLSRGQLTAVFQGGVTPALIKDSAGSVTTAATVKVLFGTNTVAASICGAATTACATSDAAHVYVCQRGQSSGSEQISQVFFGDIGCATGAKTWAAPVKPGVSCAADGCSWSTSFNAATNFAGGGTGDLLSCLQGQDALGHFAIGFASVDNGFGGYQSNTARKDFRYIKVDGVVPSIENVAANKYEYWAEGVGYIPNTTASNYPANAALGKFFQTNFGTAATIAALNSTIAYTAPLFDAGFLNIPGNGGSVPNASSVAAAAFPSNPVNSYIRNVPPNNCQTPYLSPLAPDLSDYPTWQTP